MEGDVEDGGVVRGESYVWPTINYLLNHLTAWLLYSLARGPHDSARNPEVTGVPMTSKGFEMTPTPKRPRPVRAMPKPGHVTDRLMKPNMAACLDRRLRERQSSDRRVENCNLHSRAVSMIPWMDGKSFVATWSTISSRVCTSHR